MNNSNTSALKKDQAEVESQVFRFFVYSFVFALVETINLGGVYNSSKIFHDCLVSGATVGLLLYDAINDNQAWKTQWKEKKSYLWIEFSGIIFFILSFNGIPFFLDYYVYTHFFTVSLIYKLTISAFVFITSFFESFIIAFTLLLFCFKLPIIPKIVTPLYKILHWIMYKVI